MPLLTVVIILVVIGVALYLINAYAPMDPKIKGILNAVVTVAVLLWILQMFLPPSCAHYRIGH